MKQSLARCLSIFGCTILLATNHAAEMNPTGSSVAQQQPTLFLIGDSTVKNSGGKGTNEVRGWGNVLGNYFDATKITVTNFARGGRSSRTYFSEGIWEAALPKIHQGDFVFMQFGHNDGSAPDEGKMRGSLKGIGEETLVVTNKASDKMETVHTYGWYLRHYIADTKSKGATPIVFSPIPQNEWDGQHVIRGASRYEQWAREVAQEEHVAFVNLNELVAKRYDELGREKVRRLFGPDHTHTNRAGARLNALCVVEGLQGLEHCPLASCLVANIETFDFDAATSEPGQPASESEAEDTGSSK